MSVSVRKIEGVESVKVSLNDGKATILLKPGNSVSLAQVRKAVEDNGFTPKGAMVKGRAEVIMGPGGARLKITGPDTVYDVAASTKTSLRREIKTQQGKTVDLEGVIPAPNQKATMGAIEVTAVKVAS